MLLRLAGVLGLILGGLAIGAGVMLWSPLPAHPDPEPLREAAQAYDAEIIRDRWGIPHVFGARDRDTAFGIAYAHAEDDFETIQEVVAASRGVLARYRGVPAAATDYLVALLEVQRTAEGGLGGAVGAPARALAQGYADGLNLYAADHLDETWRGLLPFTAQDVIAGFVLKAPLFYGLDGILLELFTGEGDRQLERSAAARDEQDGRDGEGPFIPVPTDYAPEGSNAFALSSRRSEDGRTHLVVNSHQPLEGPVAWYEAHLVSGEGLDIYGGLFPGTPLVLHGFNRDLGWASTVNKPDLADVYRLVTEPERPGQYRLDGRWLDFEVSEAEIEIGLWGPFAFTAKRQVKRTRHGPVIENETGAYALRYAGQGEARQLDQYLALNRASTREDWLAALALQALPNINYIYADKTGRIAFVHNGQFPNRIEGPDWTGDLPGDRADVIWQGYRPFAQVPKLLDPQSGFVYNANNTPFAATDGPDNLKPGDFPASMGLSESHTNRSLRIAERVRAGAPLDGAALRALKYDTAYAKRSVAARQVAEILAQDWSEDETLAAAAAHLATWDFKTDADNPAAALGVLSTIAAVTAPLTGRPAPVPGDAFRAAVDLLMAAHGRIDPPWGSVNRLIRGKMDLPLAGAPDVLRAIYPAEIGADGRLVAAAGDGMTLIVSWGPDGTVAADGIHQYGSALGRPASPHYGDQAALFAQERTRPIPLDRDAILAEATARYCPGDARP